MTAIGYTTAFLVPLLGGWLANGTGSSEAALWPAMGFAFATIALVGRSTTYRCSSIAPKAAVAIPEG